MNTFVEIEEYSGVQCLDLADGIQIVLESFEGHLVRNAL
jgi:hypothetical protein